MFSTIAPSQKIIAIGEVAADDTSMNGSIGLASCIVVEPGDREGPTAKMLERTFLYVRSSIPLDYGYGAGGLASSFCSGGHCP